jgi:uncharacterized membrane protein
MYGYSFIQVILHFQLSVQQDEQDALFAFSLLRLIASACFEPLFAHNQGVLYVQQLVYFVLKLVILFKIT